jgi:hypothetical protein
VTGLFSKLSLGTCRTCEVPDVPVDVSGQCEGCSYELDVRELLIGLPDERRRLLPDPVDVVRASLRACERDALRLSVEVRAIAKILGVCLRCGLEQRVCSCSKGATAP